MGLSLGAGAHASSAAAHSPLRLPPPHAAPPSTPRTHSTALSPQCLPWQLTPSAQVPPQARSSHASSLLGMDSRRDAQRGGGHSSRAGSRTWECPQQNPRATRCASLSRGWRRRSSMSQRLCALRSPWRAPRGAYPAPGASRAPPSPSSAAPPPASPAPCPVAPAPLSSSPASDGTRMCRTAAFPRLRCSSICYSSPTAARRNRSSPHTSHRLSSPCLGRPVHSRPLECPPESEQARKL
mmetsp:Transcript_48084/g.98232  ORF Transcript_48084/g.98232 Transcript_48084/m.98232 type:complete len:239 (+) Transcript_48084:277-993(+)